MIPELSRSSDPGSGTGGVVAFRAKKAKLPVEVELINVVSLVGKKKSTSHAPVAAVQSKPECLLAGWSAAVPSSGPFTITAPAGGFGPHAVPRLTILTWLKTSKADPAPVGAK